MTTSNAKPQPRASAVAFTDAELIVTLVDGRRLSVPLSWYGTLASATRQQLEDYEFLGNGEGIHWPQLDEDLSVSGLLLGRN
jgi:hypothetical protein